MVFSFLTTTLGRYIALHLLRSILLVLLFCSALVFLIDFTELLRRTASIEGLSRSTVLLLSAMRTPEIIEEIIPFAILFGSMGTLFTLSKKLELVVVRSVGVSVWQFMTPGFLIALLIGVVATTLYNPLTTQLSDAAKLLEAQVFKRQAVTNESGEIWLRLGTETTEVYLGAKQATTDGTKLFSVTLIENDKAGKLLRRIDAESATLGKRELLLGNATITELNKTREFSEEVPVKLDLSPKRIRATFESRSSPSFWQLPGAISEARAANQPALYHRLQYQSLLAQPIFFLSMLVIAATVSLRYLRVGRVGNMILTGIVASFVLYVIRSVAEDLGNGGVVHPILAAWVPAFVALILGLTLLLHQEDG